MPRALASRRSRLAALLAGGVLVFAAGCSDAEAGTLLGAGIGTLAGQAIGNDTTGTVIGAAAGGAIGYGLGNESDKRKADRTRYRRYEY